MMPRMKKVIVLGDIGVNALVPPDFWKETVDAMIHELHQSDALTALREGLQRLGDTLAHHWPRTPGDVNELPDELLR